MDEADGFSAVREAWASVAAKYEAYRLVLPGDPAFLCQPLECDAYCCRAFSVSLGEREVAHFERKSGLSPLAFLELEDGEPIALPLAQPYLLARTDGRCSMLGADLSCTQYEARPDACRLFPYQILFVDRTQRRRARPSAEERSGAVAAMLQGAPGSDVTAFLVGHTECPGFTAPPLSQADWEALVGHIYDLQFGEEQARADTTPPNL